MYDDEYLLSTEKKSFVKLGLLDSGSLVGNESAIVLSSIFSRTCSLPSKSELKLCSHPATRSQAFALLFASLRCKQNHHTDAYSQAAQKCPHSFLRNSELFVKKKAPLSWDFSFLRWLVAANTLSGEGNSFFSRLCRPSRGFVS